MGNWRTVEIEGSIAPEDLDVARVFVNTGEDWDRFHPLCNYGPSLCGLGGWIGETINAVGNLSERGYSVEDVAFTLRRMAALVPSMRLKVHCGGDYESTGCVATITVADGVVKIGPPEVVTVGAGLTEAGLARLAEIVSGQPRTEEQP